MKRLHSSEVNIYSNNSSETTRQLQSYGNNPLTSIFETDKDKLEAIKHSNMELEHQQQVNHLKECLRAQAIELAALRQESLAKKMSATKEMDSLKSELEVSRREVVKLNAQSRYLKQNGEIKIAELQQTIKTLGSRSDLHAQVASARHDLETEKLTSHHLRFDLDSYRNMMEDEKAKVSLLRKELATVQAMLDRELTVRTLADIPGVDPCTLIEIMGSHIIHLKSEISMSKSLAAQSQLQINSLQKALNSTTRLRHDTDNLLPENDAALRKMNKKGNLDMSLLSEYDGKLPTIIIDGDTTPQKLLDSLDASMLAQKVLVQEALIAELKAQNHDLEDDLIKIENARVTEMSEFEGKMKIELDGSLQRQSVIKIALDESKNEINLLKERNRELENTIISIQVSASESQVNQFMNTGEVNSKTSNDTVFTGNDVDNIEELNEELEATKHLLRERTTQLKVIMDTIDTFQVAGVKSRDTLGGVHDADNLMDLAYAAAAAPTNNSDTISSPWSTEALVKRIVDLTMDLSSQTAKSAIDERKVQHLEEEMRKRVKEINKIKNQLRKEEDNNNVMTTNMIALGQQVRDCEKKRIDDVRQLQIENEELVSALKDTESQLKSASITIEELQQRVMMTEQLDFQQWLESVIIGNIDNLVETKAASQGDISDENKENKDKNSAINTATGSTDSNSVKDLLNTLLTQWRDHVGTYSGRSLGNNSNSATKAEQRFLQRVSDLVLSANERCMKAQSELISSESRYDRLHTTVNIYKNKLKSCLQHLHRYRNRAYAAEAVIVSSKKHVTTQYESLVSMLRKCLSNERMKSTVSNDALTLERRANKLLEGKLSIETFKLSKIQAKLAEYEAKGTNMIRERDNAVAMLESKLKVSEESLQKFIRIELPRLVSGFPISEDAFATYDVAVDYFNSNTSTGNNKIDHTFALVQALSSTKSAQSIQDMRITGLLEKNSILKERNIELEGVLAKWKNDIEGTKNIATYFEECLTKWGNNQSMLASEQEVNKLKDQIYALNDKILDLEENNVALQGSYEHSSERSEEMRRLVDVIMKEEQTLKSKATQQITQVRLHLESEHASELRSIREMYESEKRALVNELDQVSAAAEQVRDRAKDTLFQHQSLADQINAATLESDKADSILEGLRATHSGSNVVGTPTDNAFKGNRKKGGKTRKSSKDAKDSPSTESVDSDTREEMVTVSMSKLKLQEDKVVELRKSLELEKLRYIQAQREIQELNDLLASQRTAFATQEKYVTNSQISNHDYINHVEREVAQEDKSLWPNMNNQIEELISILKSLNNVPNASTQLDNRVKTAVAMALRIKAIAQPNSTSAGHPPLPSPASYQPDNTYSDNNIVKSLQTLASKVRHIETDFTNENVPERHTYLLRELRSRVIDIEKSVSEEIERANIKNIAERNDIMRQLDEKTAELDQLRGAHQSAFDNIRRRYEESIREAEDRYNDQLNTTTSQMTRIENILRATQSENTSLKSELSHVKEVMQSNRKVEPSVPYDQYNNQAEELVKVQRQLDQTLGELMDQKNKTLAMVANHKNEMEELRQSFARYRRAQDEIGKTLESQISELRSNNMLLSATNASSSVISVGATGDNHISAMDNSDAEERIRKLEYKFRTKSSELDAVMRALSRTSNAGSADNSLSQSILDEDSHSIDVPPHGISAIAPINRTPDSTRSPSDYVASGAATVGINPHNPYRYEVYEVRLTEAEREIEQVNDLLSKEKKLTASLREQVAQLLRQIEEFNSKLVREDPARDNVPDQSTIQPNHGEITGNSNWTVSLPEFNAVHANPGNKPNETSIITMSDTYTIADRFLHETVNEFTLNDNEYTKERVKAFLKRMNELRRIGRSEIIRLKQTLNAAHALENKTQDELTKLKVSYADLKMQIHTLREENHRKAKLLNSLRSSKVAEEHSVEQWKTEAREAEEQAKRLLRSISSKDTLIKDLKTRLETLEEATMEAQKHAVASVGGLNADINEMSVAELKNRLRVLEIDKVKHKQSLKLSKERITELENEIKLMKEELDKLNKLSEQAMVLKTTANRKDTLVKQLRSQVEKIKEDYDQLKSNYDILKADYDRKTKTQQRHLDNLERKNNELIADNNKLKYEINIMATTRQSQAADMQDEDYGGDEDEVAMTTELSAAETVSLRQTVPITGGSTSAKVLKHSITMPVPKVNVQFTNVPKVLQGEAANDLSEVMAALMGKL
jgi:chromosome segregation ATPase